MELIPKDLAKSIPKLYESEGEVLEEKMVYVKLFTPDSNWTWWVLEYDEDERVLFCVVDGFERELGYVSLDELESIQGKLGLSVERDIHFTPKRYKEIEELSW